MSKTRIFARLFFILALAVATGAGAQRLFAQPALQPEASCGEGFRRLCKVVLMPDGSSETQYWD